MASALVTRVGNLTDDPELRFTPDGKAVANVNIAYEPYDPETKKTGDTVFYRINVWEDMAEHVCETLKKGMRVIVQGIPKVEKYTTKEGEDREQKVITATAIGPELRFATAVVNRIKRAGATVSSEPVPETF